MWSGGHDGTHDPRDVPGILGLLGPGIEGVEGDVVVGLEDLAPTILAVLDLSIPKDMDGHPISLALS
jgi:predicted AlkP superfamily phosphohydrolase/phosphomutase